jgi:hypothetical protein
MKRLSLGALVLLGLLTALSPISVSGQTAKPAPAPKTDADIKQVLIRESIASYAGNCPCPYNRDRAGRSCGRRSAYSRPGGAAPLCFAEDVTTKMVDDYRAKTGQRRPPVSSASRGER